MANNQVSTKQKNNIVVSLSDLKLQEQLRELVSQKFEVTITDERINGEEADLYIVDSKTYKENRTHLKELKSFEAPVMLPVLLLVNDDSLIVELSEEGECIDDVISESHLSHFLMSKLDMLVSNRMLSKKVLLKEQKLKKKDEQIETFLYAFNAIDSGIVITDARQDDNPIIFCNEYFEKLTGYKSREILGRNCRFLQGDHRDQNAADKIRSFIEKGEKGSAVIKNYKKDGTSFWNELKILPMAMDEKGGISHFLGIQKDVTELVTARGKVEAEKEFLHSAVNNMPGIFYMLDEDLNYIFWNDKMESEFGYSYEEIEEIHPLAFFRPEDHEMINQKIQEVFRTGSAKVEADLITREGDKIPYYLNATYLQRDGKSYLIGSGVNISERVEAEFKSLQREQLLNAIINQSESVIYVKDSEGRYSLVNKSYLELFGIDYEEVIGKTDRELYPKELTANVVGNDKQVLEEGRSLEVEEEIPLSTGVRQFLTTKYPLSNVPGFENSLCGISTDITERNRTLSKLQERIKEQACLYNIAKLNGSPRSVEELLSKVVTFLPVGWQYPEIAEASIEYGDYCYTTDGYKKSEWTISNNGKEVQGSTLNITVAYLQKKPLCYEGPFLKEERQLINAISDMVASQIERITSQIKLKESEKRWENLVQNDPDLIQIMEGSKVTFVNKAGIEMYGAKNAEEIIGKEFTELVSLGDTELAKERIRKVMRGETVPPHVHRVKAMDGEIRYVEIQSLPITYSDGQHAIQVVGKDVTNRLEYEERLQESLREKEVLLQEIHHRVKNNLAVISGLLQIQQMHADDKKVERVLSNSAMRVKSMGLIHEKLYSATSLSEIDLKNYIEDLSLTIQDAMKLNEKVSLQFDCESITINVNQAVPCALLLNELITNALEHAFPQTSKGSVHLKIRERENKVAVEVKDDGVGMPQGFNREEARSMGFTIINTLVSQLDADLDIENSNGTKISFAFVKRTVKGSSSNML